MNKVRVICEQFRDYESYVTGRRSKNPVLSGADVLAGNGIATVADVRNENSSGIRKLLPQISDGVPLDRKECFAVFYSHWSSGSKRFASPIYRNVETNLLPLFESRTRQDIHKISPQRPRRWRRPVGIKSSPFHG